VIIIANSMVQRSLKSSEYNDRRLDCEEAVGLLLPFFPGIKNLRDISLIEFENVSHNLPEVIARRARHVIAECERVEEAAECLLNADLAGFGGLMLAGHESLRDLFEVSCPELDLLVEIARRLPGCWGARLTGAGFGGCTVNLVEEAHADNFISRIREVYKSKTGCETETYLCRASRGAYVEGY
jgi:galactokinase